MKKILFLINNLDKGGAEKILSNIANYISKDDYKVTVCYFGNKIYYEFSDEINLIKISKIKFNIFKTIKEYKKILNDHGSNNKTVISHLNYANYYNIFLSFFLKHRPIIVLHYSLSYYLTTNLKNTLFLFPIHFILQKFLFKKAYKAISVSKAIQSSYKYYLQLNSSLIYNPIYDKNFILKKEFSPFRKNKINILVVGSFINVKNHIELCQCIKLKIKEFSEKNSLQFIFIGNGPLINKIKDYTISNNINHLVIFMGLVDKIQNYYMNADFLITTSKLEGLPTVMIESLTYDKPVISTFQLSSLEILENNIEDYDKLKKIVNKDIIKLNNGILYKLGNISQLAKAIKYVVRNKKLYQSNKRNREKVLKLFSIKNSNQYKEIN